jgi:hypothetical protein
MADGPDRPPGQRSLFDLGVTRVEKRPPPEVDRAEVELEMEAKRQARKQREASGPSSARCGSGVAGSFFLNCRVALMASIDYALMVCKVVARP